MKMMDSTLSSRMIAISLFVSLVVSLGMLSGCNKAPLIRLAVIMEVQCKKAHLLRRFP
jgi:hypothetical protein